MSLDPQKVAELRAHIHGHWSRVLSQKEALPILDELERLQKENERLKRVLGESRDAVKYAVDHVLPAGAVKEDFTLVLRKANRTLGEE